jgi:hypothetical protein
MAMTIPQGRPYLQPGYKALRLGQSIMPVLSARYRATRRIPGRAEPTFERFFYTDAVEQGLTLIGKLALRREGVAFCPMQAKPGAEGWSMAWVMLDASGARKVGRTAENLPMQEQGGGGAWVLYWTKHGSPPVLRWRYRAWTSSELAWHSTRLEAVNATETADVVMAEGVQDIVLVMDNASWIQDARAMSCGSESMIEPLQCFSTLLAKYSDARVFLVFNDRTRGQEADAISKALLRLPEFQGKRGWEFASERLVARGFAALSLANMLEPRVKRGVRADADRASGIGNGFVARCKAAGRELAGEEQGLPGGSADDLLSRR